MTINLKKTGSSLSREASFPLLPQSIYTYLFQKYNFINFRVFSFHFDYHKK